MDVYQFISSIVSAAAWPVAVVTSLIALRGSTYQLLPKMKTAEAPGFRATFAQEIETVAVDSRRAVEGLEVLLPPIREEVDGKTEPATATPEIARMVARVGDEAWASAEARLQHAQTLALTQPDIAVPLAAGTIVVAGFRLLIEVKHHEDPEALIPSENFLLGLAQAQVFSYDKVERTRKLLEICTQVENGEKISSDSSCTYVLAATRTLGEILEATRIYEYFSKRRELRADAK